MKGNTNTDMISENRTFIMGVAMLSIMCFHQPWFYGHGVDTFFYHFGYWGVDFFLFVSGFGIAHSLEKNKLGTYYKNRLVRLLPYCLAFGVIRALLYYYGIHGFVLKYNPPVGLVACSLDLWYIEAITLFYCLAPLLKRAVDSFPILVFLFFIGLSLLIQYMDKPSYIDDYLLLRRTLWACNRLPVFVLGMWMYKSLDRFNSKVTIALGGGILNCSHDNKDFTLGINFKREYTAAGMSVNTRRFACNRCCSSIYREVTYIQSFSVVR